MSRKTISSSLRLKLDLLRAKCGTWIPAKLYLEHAVSNSDMFITRCVKSKCPRVISIIVSRPGHSSYVGDLSEIRTPSLHIRCSLPLSSVRNLHSIDKDQEPKPPSLKAIICPWPCSCNGRCELALLLGLPRRPRNTNVRVMENHLSTRSSSSMARCFTAPASERVLLPTS